LHYPLWGQRKKKKQPIKNYFKTIIFLRYNFFHYAQLRSQNQIILHNKTRLQKFEFYSKIFFIKWLESQKYF
jgi:hypothetical protein